MRHTGAAFIERFRLIAVINDRRSAIGDQRLKPEIYRRMQIYTPNGSAIASFPFLIPPRRKKEDDGEEEGEEKKEERNTGA